MEKPLLLQETLKNLSKLEVQMRQPPCAGPCDGSVWPHPWEVSGTSSSSIRWRSGHRHWNWPPHCSLWAVWVSLSARLAQLLLLEAPAGKSRLEFQLPKASAKSPADTSHPGRAWPFSFAGFRRNVQNFLQTQELQKRCNDFSANSRSALTLYSSCHLAKDRSKGWCRLKGQFIVSSNSQVVRHKIHARHGGANGQGDRLWVMRGWNQGCHRLIYIYSTVVCWWFLGCIGVYSYLWH